LDSILTLRPAALRLEFELCIGICEIDLALKSYVEYVDEIWILFE